LGTGGALKNAEAFLNARPFLVHNSDIVSDIDLEKLIEFHLSSDNLVTLAVHDYPKFNKLELDEKGFLRDIGTGHPHPAKLKYLAFTGIAVYSPDFLRFLPSGASSVVDAWLKAIKAGYRVGTFDVSGCYWSDIGTAASYASTIIKELRENGEYIYVHPSIKACTEVDMDGYVVIEEGAFLDERFFLRNCILLPGSKIETKKYIDKSHIPLLAKASPSPPLAKGGKGGFLIENCILGPGFKIDLKKSEMLGLNGETDVLLIGTGGSDRKYYRVKKNRNTEILMQCSTSDPDFQRHMEYTQFFQKYSIPVPKLIRVEIEKMSATFEDLGDLSLYSYLKCPREQEEIEAVYKRAIDILILMHTVMTEHITECPLLQNRIFDYEYLRWETSYFIERFVEDIMDIRLKNPSVLNDEFHRLASKVDSFPKTVVHRDFQSQNIMITRGGIPRIVDYQGARMGPPAYDIVSLLWDPYYRLEDDMRDRLLEHYIGKMIEFYKHNKDDESNPFIPSLAKHPSIPPLAKGGKRGFFNKIDFKETLLPCRLQRHMQALGAYGFLSKIKGKKYFLKYMPEGLRSLKEEVSLSRDEYPELHNLVMSL
jgi:aminoglycoside/choline kinase family phosphotransferase